MGLFPWEDFFYKISQRSHSLNEKYNQYQHVRDSILLNGSKHTTRLQQLRSQLTTNYALLIVLTIADMSDSEYEDFLGENNEDRPDSVSGYGAAPWLEGSVELLGFGGVLKFLSLGSRAIKLALAARAARAARGAAAVAEEPMIEMANLLRNVGMVGEGGAEAGAEAVGEGGAEVGAEAVGEGGAEAGAEAVVGAVAEGGVVSASALALSAASVFAAVGIDAILGAINGV